MGKLSARKIIFLFLTWIVFANYQAFGQQSQIIKVGDSGFELIPKEGYVAASITHTTVTSELMDHIATLKNVREIHISCLKEEIEIKEGALEPLGKMTWLRLLDLVIDDEMEGKELQFIDKLSSLEDLTIRGRVTVDNWNKICKLKTLKCLDLTAIDELPRESAAKLKDLSSLRRLQISNAVPSELITQLLEKRKVQSLAVEFAPD